MKIGIVINTYKKPGSKELLTRAINSVLQQTYTNWKIYLVGDAYEDEHEFKSCAKLIPIDKVYYTNLPVSVEREKYLNVDPQKLWCCGGVTARNHGINIAIDEVEWICHLDHDDYWDTNHLQLIVDTIMSCDDKLSFVHTLGTYFGSYLPYIPIEQGNVAYVTSPRPGNVIHSSVCINHKKIPLIYRDVFQEIGQVEPADADLWTRISTFLIHNNLYAVIIPKLTVYHPTEGV